MADAHTDQTVNLNVLKCTECQIVMIPPIFCFCPTKHGYCKDCHLDLGSCIRCPGPSNIILRNDELEAVSRNAKHRCRWNMQGCGQFLYDEIRAHEYTCQFRMYNCHECEISVSFEEIKCHIHFEHDYMKLVLNNYYQSNRKEETLLCMLCYEEIFICDVSVKPDTMAWSVRLSSGRYSRARDFKVYLDIFEKRWRLPIPYTIPYFELELPNTELPRDDNFFYRLILAPRSCFPVVDLGLPGSHNVGHQL